MGSSREDNLKVDMIVDCQEDCIKKLSDILNVEDDQAKVTQ